MKKKIHTTAVILGAIVVSLLIFSYSVKHNHHLKGTEDVQSQGQLPEVLNKKNQFELPFLESLTRHLLALGH